MTKINLNPDTNMTLDEIEEKKKGYVLEERELKLKEKMGMPMAREEWDRYEKIEALIEQCNFVIEWMTIFDEDEYDWTID